MLLHALDDTQKGATSITIQNPDTDVLVLTLWVYKILFPDTTVTVGTGGQRRSIPLGPLYEAVGEELVKALPGFRQKRQAIFILTLRTMFYFPPSFSFLFFPLPQFYYFPSSIFSPFIPSSTTLLFPS